jgi:hypothetical protein
MRSQSENWCYGRQNVTASRCPLLNNGWLLDNMEHIILVKFSKTELRFAFEFLEPRLWV